jgi:hypothetical protein
VDEFLFSVEKDKKQNTKAFQARYSCEIVNMVLSVVIILKYLR